MRIALACVLLAACTGADPRFGEATISSASPQATLSGTTFGQAAALELAPGCPGYLDPEQPAHVVHVTESLSARLRVRSPTGPVALAVARGDEVRCDSDEGSGHAPELEIEGAGDYLVYVAALRAPAELPYTLTVSSGAEDAAIVGADGSREVSVTITSQPSGATVRDTDGRVLGTTPAMFVVTAGASEEEKSFVLDLARHRSTTVTGRLAGGAVVLHGQLSEIGPTRLARTADDPQPIRDYRTATLAVDVGEACAIESGEVEVDIQHTFVGDLRVVLHTPWSTEHVLHRHGGGSRSNLARTWSTADEALRALVGRQGRGRWQLVVHDDAGADVGTLRRFDLRLVCGGEDVASAPEPRDPPERPSVDPVVRTPRLPDLPAHADIVAVLARLRPSVEQRCTQSGGNVRLYFTLAGSGSVTRVSTSGTASSTEQSCVAQVVRRARFPQFRRSSLDVDYTYDLRRAPSPPTSTDSLVSPFRPIRQY